MLHDGLSGADRRAKADAKHIVPIAASIFSYVCGDIDDAGTAVSRVASSVSHAVYPDLLSANHGQFSP